jgi:hypothetical protein
MHTTQYQFQISDCSKFLEKQFPAAGYNPFGVCLGCSDAAFGHFQARVMNEQILFRDRNIQDQFSQIGGFVEQFNDERLVIFFPFGIPII